MRTRLAQPPQLPYPPPLPPRTAVLALIPSQHSSTVHPPSALLASTAAAAPSVRAPSVSPACPQRSPVRAPSAPPQRNTVSASSSSPACQHRRCSPVRPRPVRLSGLPAPQPHPPSCPGPPSIAAPSAPRSPPRTAAPSAPRPPPRPGPPSTAAPSLPRLTPSTAARAPSAPRPPPLPPRTAALSPAWLCQHDRPAVCLPLPPTLWRTPDVGGGERGWAARCCDGCSGGGRGGCCPLLRRMFGEERERMVSVITDISSHH